MGRRPGHTAITRLVTVATVTVITATMTVGCSSTTPESAEPATLRVSASSPFDTAVVVNQDGLTVYRFNNDQAEPPTSTCVDQCAERWPPVTAGGDVIVEGLDGERVGTLRRPDGTEQVTLSGWPLYTFSGDQRAGDFLGQAVSGAWFAVAPDGEKADGINRTS